MIINQIASSNDAAEYVTYSGTCSRSDIGGIGSVFSFDIDVGAPLGDDFALMLITDGSFYPSVGFVASMFKPLGASGITSDNRMLGYVDDEHVYFAPPANMGTSRTEEWTVTRNGNVITISGSTTEEMSWNDVYEFTGEYRWYVTTTA